MGRRWEDWLLNFEDEDLKLNFRCLGSHKGRHIHVPKWWNGWVPKYMKTELPCCCVIDSYLSFLSNDTAGTQLKDNRWNEIWCQIYARSYIHGYNITVIYLTSWFSCLLQKDFHKNQTNIFISKSVLLRATLRIFFFWYFWFNHCGQWLNRT